MDWLWVLARLHVGLHRWQKRASKVTATHPGSGVLRIYRIQNACQDVRTPCRICHLFRVSHGLEEEAAEGGAESQDPSERNGGGT